MWGSITQTLKGWKTIIWSGFVTLLGAITAALTALNGDMVAALLPDRYKPFSPVVYSLAMTAIGGITGWLRFVTDTPVGQSSPLDPGKV